jgi:hypothetical protein
MPISHFSAATHSDWLAQICPCQDICGRKLSSPDLTSLISPRTPISPITSHRTHSPFSPDLSHPLRDCESRWTKQKSSWKCRANSSKTVGGSSRDVANVCIPLPPTSLTLLDASPVAYTPYSGQARISPHQPSSRDGLFDHGRDWVCGEAE